MLCDAQVSQPLPVSEVYSQSCVLFLSQMCVTFPFTFTQISDKIQKLLNSCSADIPTPSEYYQRFPKMIPGFPKVAECSSAKHQILAPSCQGQAYLSENTKTRYRETLTYDLGHFVPFTGHFCMDLMLIVTEQVVRNYGLCM